MYILDEHQFQTQLKKKGYRSISQLAKNLGIHRNTIHHYLSGNSVFPEKLDAIFLALDLDFKEAIVKRQKFTEDIAAPIAKVIDELHAKFPEATFILFGSRAQGTARKYSDWDLGVFCRKGLPHEVFCKIRRKKIEFEEKSPYFIDLINLNRGDQDFLKEVSQHWIFLTGKRQDWIELQKKVFYENK